VHRAWVNAVEKSPGHAIGAQQRIVVAKFLGSILGVRGSFWIDIARSPQNPFSTASIKGCLRDDLAIDFSVAQ
jgi:hypothetical protein